MKIESKLKSNHESNLKVEISEVSKGFFENVTGKDTVEFLQAKIRERDELANLPIDKRLKLIK